MKKISIFGLTLGLFLITIACNKDRDDEFNQASNQEINNFIYEAMNIWYLYKPNVPALADDRFDNIEERNRFLNSFESPEDFFNNGVTAPESIDRFSFIVDDYRELEREFSGVTLNNGMSFNAGRFPEGSNAVIGVVRYVLPNTSAASQNVVRGMIFNTIDGQALNVNNFGSLTSQDTYTIGLADLDANGAVVSNGKTISLTKQEYTANPILIRKTLAVEGKKVGYLMYNSFTADFDAQLNDAFGQFKSEGIDALVLDLRYNGGGSVRTATDLAAMITGQFPDEIFSTEVFNPQLQAIFETDNAESLNNRFNTKISAGAKINSLNLTKLYVITTGRTASASELIINGLDPYIEVIQVGTTTTGKFQASTTFYDSEIPEFNRNGANPNHFYAIQPLILTSANADGVTGFVDGIAPEVEQGEFISNYGVLGEPTEPLLQKVLDEIRGGRRATTFQTGPTMQVIGESGMDSPIYQRMYVDQVR